VTLKPATQPADDAALSARRSVQWLGVAAIVALLSGGGYGLWRTVRREMAVGRIQTDFVAAVSHEFRTPLTSLQHVTELLAEDDDVPPEQRQSLYASLGRNTDRLRGLVESLLDFARMEDGRKPYALQRLDVSTLVRSVVDEFEGQSREELAIATDLPPVGTVSCQADPSAIKHVLWNLLDNAVKYSPAPRDIRVAVELRDRHVAIAVSDRGFGIPRSEHTAVFQKFVRGSNTEQRGIKGTGLGLAMVAHIVAAHGGRIDLESEVGQGSTLTVLIPALPDGAVAGWQKGIECPGS
jgi:signal transduction histidine kinase